jgi:hypothetical protein
MLPHSPFLQYLKRDKAHPLSFQKRTNIQINILPISFQIYFIELLAVTLAGVSVIALAIIEVKLLIPGKLKTFPLKDSATADGFRSKFYLTI